MFPYNASTMATTTLFGTDFPQLWLVFVLEDEHSAAAIKRWRGEMGYSAGADCREIDVKASNGDAPRKGKQDDRLLSGHLIRLSAHRGLGS